MYFGVLAVEIIGAIIARLQPHGMARALFATGVRSSVSRRDRADRRVGSPVERTGRDPGTKWVLHRVVCRIGLAVSACCAWVTPNGFSDHAGEK
jgi:hypothetical protein